jgi:hypothetical protein
MLMLMEGFFDLPRHGEEVDGAGRVIPIKFDTAIQVAFPIEGNGVIEFSLMDFSSDTLTPYCDVGMLVGVV